MARDTRQPTTRPIESYEHRDKERANNPPVGLVTPENDPDTGQKKKRYAYDPHLAPEREQPIVALTQHNPHQLVA